MKKTKQARILIVEENKTQAKQLKAILATSGYKSTISGNYDQAIASLTKMVPDIIFSGILMPGLDGYDLCKKIKEDENLKNIQFIFLTSLNGPEDIFKGLKSGADGFILKPIIEDTIISCIENIFNNREMQKRELPLIGLKVFWNGEYHFISGESLNIIDVIFKAMENNHNDLEVTKIFQDDSREYSESIINTIREPLISLDQDLRVVSASRSFYEVFKVNPKETIGQLIYDLGNKQWDIPKLRELLETILPQKTAFDNYEVEHDFTAIGRRVMLLNARQILRRSGKEHIILLAIEDITERRMIENGLEKARKELEVIKISEDASREYSESIINTIREPLISLNQDLRVVSASRSFYEVFKVNPKETVGQLIYDLGNKQWDIPKLRELLETILPQKTAFDNYEVEHDFTAIGRRVMLLNARQILRGMGKERIILLAIEDITERREIENVLEKAHGELKELASELEQTSRVKSEFLANMSHELRTPLNSINGFSEVLYDETFGPLNEKQKKYVNNVLTSGRHLLLLINQILDMAKVEAGKMKLALSILPTKNLLNEISMLVEDMVSKKKLQMFLEIEEDLQDIEADELKVKEIIYNLLSNAINFTPEGGKIGMKARKVDSDIEVIVWDTGVGIAAENMKKIFEGFFRVDTPYSRVTEGTGLGLPLSKKLVELHSGKFFVESEGLGKGTLVRFTLPILFGTGV